jgi:hypothetical protein
MKSVKLFVSLGYALNAITDERVGTDELNRSLFYFKCHTLAWAADVEKCVNAYVSQQETERQQKMRVGHVVLMEALSRAQNDGRIIWPDRQERSVYEDLSRLLTTNGHQPPNLMSEAEQDIWNPSFPEMRDACPHVEVLSHYLR